MIYGHVSLVDGKNIIYMNVKVEIYERVMNDVGLKGSDGFKHK